jgi:hypothetical protein
MRRLACLAVAGLVLVACQAPVIRTEPDPAEKAGRPSGDAQPEPAFDGWTVQVSVAPGTVGPIVVEVGPVRAAQASNSRPWVQHDVIYRNRGDRTVRFEDTRTSLFLGGREGPLLAADPGCGYGKPRRKPVEPGACLLYLDAFVVRPGATVRRTITLFKDLRGMEPLTRGPYVWDKAIRFRVGSPDSPVRKATIHLTYELSPAGG